MPAERKSFVCRVCGSPDGYTRVAIPLRQTGVTDIFYCNKCTSVFASPKKFSNPNRWLSEKEINELIKLGDDFDGDVSGGKIPTVVFNY